MPAKQLTTEECESHLYAEDYGRLSTCGPEGQPYITPLNYLYLDNHIYFHAGFEGQKLSNIAENPSVCFEISGAGELTAMPRACNFTMHRWSVLAIGTASVLFEANQKLVVMQAFMKKYAPHCEYTPLTIEDMGTVNVLDITVDKISGREG